MLDANEIDGTQPSNGGNGSAGQGRLIGHILVDTAGLRPEHLAEALERQKLLAAKHRYYLLGRILIGLGYVNVNQVNNALAVQRAASREAGASKGATASRRATSVKS